MTNREIINAYNATGPHMEAQIDESTFYLYRTRPNHSPFDSGDEFWSDDAGLTDEDTGLAESKSGYGARLSASGYLDCTDWAVFDTREEAEAYLVETYPEMWPGEPENGFDA